MAGEVPADIVPDDQEVADGPADGEQGAVQRTAERQPLNLRDTPCRLCEKLFTSRGIKIHEKSCEKKQMKVRYTKSLSLGVPKVPVLHGCLLYTSPSPRD